MKKMLDTIKNMFSKLFGKAKSAAAKAAETPEAQDAAHTAATAMSESMPMSGINGKKIVKTLLRNYFILIAGTLFSLSLFVIYKFSAKDGNVSANLKLADYYMTGIPYFLDKNPEKAEEQLRKFIEKYVDLDTPEQDNFKKDIINSIKNLNQLNETQIKPEKNNSQYLGINVPGISRQRALWLQKKDTLNCAAVSELKKDAEDKESDTQIISQRDIGGLYLIGECVEKDIKKAEEYLAKAAKKGDVKAKRNLGIIYLENYAKKEKDAFYLLLNAAENGDGIAQSKIGFMYLNKKNYDTPFYIKFSKKRMDLYRIKKAEYWLRRSAEQGLSEGEFGLGLIYLYSYLEELRKYGDKTYSEVILPDPAEAEKWFKKSADQGHPDSALALADMYHDGIGVPQQEMLSFSLLEKLSEEGNESAELRIASLYHTGDRLIRKDDVEALRRFTLLSNKGNVYAKSYLANMYATGNGVSQNYDAAYKLYKNLITEHGEYINLLNIMILYEHIINDNVNNNILSYFNLRKEIYSFIEEEINLNEKKDVTPHYPLSKEDRSNFLYRIGRVLYYGDDIFNANHIKAKKYLKLAAEEGDIYSKKLLASIVSLDNDSIQKKEIANNIYENIVRNFENSYQNLFFNEKSKINCRLAKQYYKKAENSKNSFIKSINYRKAFSIFKKLYNTEQYNPYPATYLGLMYLKGTGVNQNYAKALEYFSKGEESILSYGDGAKFSGDNFPFDIKQTKTDKIFAEGFIRFFDNDPTYKRDPIWYRDTMNDDIFYFNDDLEFFVNEAAKKGDPDAKKFLEKVLSGIDTREKWLNIFAKKGNSYAQMKLGDIYLKKGEYKKAKGLYEKSSYKNNLDALVKLADMYFYGNTEQKANYKKAIELYTKAFNKGSFYAAMMLSLIYKYWFNDSAGKKYYDKGVQLFKYWTLVPNNKRDSNYLFAKAFYSLSTGFSDNSFAINILQELSENNPLIQTYLGDMYAHGVIVQQNNDKAKELYKKAVDKKFCPAISRLAFMYYEGIGVEKNYIKSHELLKIGAEQSECSICRLGLIQMYLNRDATPENLDQGAFYWAKKTANNGYSAAQLLLGNMYDNGEFTKKDEKKAFYWYLRASKQDNPMAQYLIGNAFFLGKGVKQSYKKAFKWYLVSSELGFPAAEFALGSMYEEGKGVQQNYSKAAWQYRKAAIKGYPEAQYKLGYMYENGIGVFKNIEESVKWYQFAYAQSNNMSNDVIEKLSYSKEKDNYLSPVESFKLCFSYYNKQDYEKAFEFCKNSAEQGYSPAQYNLGLMYAQGIGIKQDYAEAVKWYIKAAKQGHAQSQYNLGLMYSFGVVGVKQDLAEARNSYSKAAAQGHKEAQAALERLEKR